MAIKLDYAVQESVTNMRRNLFMSFAAVLVVTISLFLFGGFLVLRSALVRSADLITRQVRVTVFLATDISSSDREAIEADLRALPEVKSVVYEDKQEAFERFTRLFANQPDLLENVTPGALPESFRVELHDPNDFQVVADSIDGRPGVERVRDEREIVERIFSETRIVRSAGLAVSLAVGVAATVLIATTIRMAIYARRKEIGIMKLVGATNWFIRIPFMMEGVVQGMIGSVLAVVFLFLSRLALGALFEPSLDAGLAPQFGLGATFSSVTFLDIAVHGAYLLLAGILVGAVGSLVGLRKFLDV